MFSDEKECQFELNLAQLTRSKLQKKTNLSDRLPELKSRQV